MRRALVFAFLFACAPAALLAAPAAESAATASEASKSDARAVVPALATKLEENFVFPEIGKRYAEALRAKLAAGAYDGFDSRGAFAAAVTADLQAVSPDGHLKLMAPDQVSSRRRGPPAGRDGKPVRFIDKQGWLAPGVAYISFTAFPGDEETLNGVRDFLARHADAKTLIIDARGHHGGGLAEMDLIFAQIFAEPTELVVMDTRLAVEQAHGPMESAPTLRAASAPEGVVRRIHSALPAAKATGLRTAKVYLLTSDKTVSAAEHLALSLKRTHRATLIGETTRGAGHYGGVEELPGGFAAFIPVGRTFDPDTGEGWEGTGVKPDIAVPAEQALDEALKLAGVSTSGEAALAGLN